MGSRSHNTMLVLGRREKERALRDSISQIWASRGGGDKEMLKGNARRERMMKERDLLKEASAFLAAGKIWSLLSAFSVSR